VLREGLPFAQHLPFAQRRHASRNTCAILQKLMGSCAQTTCAQPTKYNIQKSKNTKTQVPVTKSIITKGFSDFVLFLKVMPI
jgi:hypothetical protein